MIVAILLVAGWGAGAQGKEATPTPAAAAPVTVAKMEPVRVAAGGRSIVRIAVQVAGGHRVQANPASNEFLVPLRIEIESVGGLDFGPPVYPEGEPYLLEGSDEVLMTYAGEFEVIVPVSAADAAAPGGYAISGELHYQACNSRMCLFPASTSVELQIVVPASEPPDTLETNR